VSPAPLLTRFGQHQRIVDIEERFACTECGNRGGNAAPAATNKDLSISLAIGLPGNSRKTCHGALPSSWLGGMLLIVFAFYVAA